MNDLYQFGDDHSEIITPWLVFDILPRLQGSHSRIQALESTVNLLTSRLSSLIEDLARALPFEHDRFAPMEARLNPLSVILQKHKDDLGCDHDMDAGAISSTGNTSKRLGIDDRVKVLNESIQASKKVQENLVNMESNQPFLMVDEPAEIAYQQRMRTVIQKLPSGLASDDSSPSTCTLTPASVSTTKQISAFRKLTTDRLWCMSQPERVVRWTMMMWPQPLPWSYALLSISILSMPIPMVSPNTELIAQFQ